MIKLVNKRERESAEFISEDRKLLISLNRKSTNRYSNFVFKTLFPESLLTDWLISNSDTDDKFKNTLNFADIGITKDDIVQAFMEEGILPYNFMTIQDQKRNLPRLKYQCK